jgi:hypothetical protein
MTNTAIEATKTVNPIQASPAPTRDDLFGTCGVLATHTNVLDHLITELNRMGFVGEERATRLIYLALTSRVFKDPVSIAMKGPSSAGKSHTTQQVLAFFPPDAYYAQTAMSEKALVYWQEPLKHRFLVVYEADGMKGEMAAYFMRSLLSEGCIKHKTLTQSPGGGWEPKELYVEGPTGLLTTTTLVSLHPENETRLLSVPVNDTEEQTRRIMLAMASEAADAEIDYARWLAFQQWLASGPTAVTIPFATRLAKVAFAGSVRIRRDFRKLLTLIRAHALIHQASRDKTEDGKIMATLEDYAAVRSLTLDLLGEAAESSVSATVRETVMGVAKLLGGGRGHVTVTQLAAELSIDKSSASRRVDEAIRSGYLLNPEDRRGHPAQLMLGDPLPEDVVVLPEVEVLA